MSISSKHNSIIIHKNINNYNKTIKKPNKHSKKYDSNSYQQSNNYQPQISKSYKYKSNTKHSHKLTLYWTNS